MKFFYFSLVLSLSLISFNVFAFGSKTEWVSGWGQGTTEYTILGMNGSSQLYFGCNPDNELFVEYIDPIGHSVTSLDILNNTTKSVYAIVDNNNAFLINDPLSDSGVSNLREFWKELRTGKQVYISGTGLIPTVFTLRKAATVLPPFNKLDCKFY